jgi:hypothetical protein
MLRNISNELFEALLSEAQGFILTTKEDDHHHIHVEEVVPSTEVSE